MDPFAAYAKQANTIVSHPAALLGPISRRADARVRYGEIVVLLKEQTDPENLEVTLLSLDRELKQFHAELEWFWKGDGADFRGLEKEIEWARARVDDRLDLPRWEPSYTEEGLGE